jgi:NAD(P)-dependent dehydrogenase (short-subunit alcohol dehydrogenase family)
MPDSSARTVVVTGAASGIGRACALRFAGAGDTVVVADMNEEQGLAAVAEIAGAGGRAAFRRLDVADRADVAAAAAAIEAEHGPVSVLVNSAGILQPIARLADFPDETHDKVWQVNYFGTYNCCKAFGLRMADRRAGAIVNIASMSSYRTMPLLAYGPGKTAIVSLTGTLAVELGVKGVRVNAVAPGNVLTPVQERNFREGRRDRRAMEGSSALNRLVMPAEIADGVYFLCSDQASAIAGITLPIDCGWLAAECWPMLGGIPHGN